MQIGARPGVMVGTCIHNACSHKVNGRSTVTSGKCNKGQAPDWLRGCAKQYGAFQLPILLPAWPRFDGKSIYHTMVYDQPLHIVVTDRIRPIFKQRQLIKHSCRRSVRQVGELRMVCGSTVITRSQH